MNRFLLRPKVFVPLVRHVHSMARSVLLLGSHWSGNAVLTLSHESGP
jgi:hypothetical protein